MCEIKVRHSGQGVFMGRSLAMVRRHGSQKEWPQGRQMWGQMYMSRHTAQVRPSLSSFSSSLSCNNFPAWEPKRKQKYLGLCKLHIVLLISCVQLPRSNHSIVAITHLFREAEPWISTCYIFTFSSWVCSHRSFLLCFRRRPFRWLFSLLLSLLEAREPIIASVWFQVKTQ